MSKSIQKREDGEKLVQLIPKMRRGECNVLETWFLRECMEKKRGYTEEVVQLLHEVCEVHEEEEPTAGEAWIRALVIYHRLRDDDEDSEEDELEFTKILTPHEQDPSCAALLSEVYQWSVYDTVIDKARGFELAKRSADADCAEGIFGLGLAYRDGLGVDKDKRRAYELVSQAASMSHPTALSEMGYYLEIGHGVELNLKLAIGAYEKACSYGDSDAHINLGSCYVGGVGVEVNGRRAASLFRKAELLGSFGARHELGTLSAEDRVPWGEWYPDPLVHKYVPLEMHHQMRTLLMIRARHGTLLSQIPKQLVLDICFWLCTNPN